MSTAIRPTRRDRPGALLAGMLAAALLWASPASAQRQPQRQVPTPIDFATSQNDNLFSLVRSQDDIHELELAIAELADGRSERAVRRLHELLRRDARGVVPVAPGRFMGLRTAVVTVLANASPAARETYEELVRREAGNLLTRPLDELSPRQLTLVAERFPTARKGLQARLMLGDRSLEAGDGLQAANHYRLALDATEIASTEEARVAERLACAEVLIEPATARALDQNGQLHAAGDEVLRVVPNTSDSQTAIGGGRSGGTPRPEPVGLPANFWREEVLAPGFDRREKGELAMFPVGDLEGLYINTGREVLALDPLRRAIQWVSSSPMRDLGDARANADSGTINQDMVLAAAIDNETVVASLQVPDKTVNVDFQAGFRIMSKIPQRRLFAFSRRSGKLLWSHFDELDGPRTRRFRGHDSCAPPIIAGDTVYAPVLDRSGAIAFAIAAYDLHTGQPKWRRLVCSSQQDVNMFGNARMEFAASPLALAGGVLYGSSNLGVTFAINAESGRVRWITAYEVVSMPRARLHGQADRQVFFANNAPVVREGVVCLTPLDSQFAIGQDIDSGEVVWRQSFDARIGGTENRVQWLVGAMDDEFILSGAGVIAVKARPDPGSRGLARARQIVRPDEIGNRRLTRLPGRPALTADHIWVPTRDRLLAFDRAGNPRAEGPGIGLDGYYPGNLMLVDGIVVSLRSRSFDVVLDPRALIERSRARVEQSPDDPAALLRLASMQRALLSDDASLVEEAAVQELYRRGLEACIRQGLPANHPTRTALQRELFEQALAAAEAASRERRDGAVERYAIARDLAPEPTAWIEVQQLILQACRSDRDRFLRELERLEQFAPTARMPAPLGIPVVAFVLWQRALANENEPELAVELWQRLLERYGRESIGPESAATLAETAIAGLIAEHGAGVYRDIAARADAALAAAAGDDGALEDVARRFPNSDAARRAGLVLMDRAVEAGNLAVACGVLERSIRADAVSASVLRRVQVAADRRGNPALADAMARRLAAFADVPSDWHEDDGVSFAAAAKAAAAGREPVATIAPRLPVTELTYLRPRSRSEYVRLLPAMTADGFGRRSDTPIYAVAGRDLVAYDPTGGDADAGGYRILFDEPIEFLEHVIVCDTTLVVPDMDRVFAVDYRTGERLWQLEFEQPRLLESLGLTDGVLHISAQPAIPNGNSELLGVEPITGVRIFSRSLADDQLKPKPIEHQLLMMTAASGQHAVLRLDPVTGRTLAEVPCAEVVGPGLLELRPDSMTTQLYPQELSGDDQRIYLPIDGRDQTAEPQVVALDADGKVAWRWRGSPGAGLLMAQRRGDRFVIAERSEQRSCGIVLLEAATGSVLREVDLGFEATVLNWERSWLDNRAPAMIAVDSLIDRQSRQRQLICFGVDDPLTFAVPLGVDDGEIERGPLFGDGFVTFGVRSRKSTGPFRLYAIDLGTRRGAFEDEHRYRQVSTRGAPRGMTAVGPYTVVSTTQGLLLLGDPREPR